MLRSTALAPQPEDDSRVNGRADEQHDKNADTARLVSEHRPARPTSRKPAGQRQAM